MRAAFSFSLSLRAFFCSDVSFGFFFLESSVSTTSDFGAGIGAVIGAGGATTFKGAGADAAGGATTSAFFLSLLESLDAGAGTDTDTGTDDDAAGTGN